MTAFHDFACAFAVSFGYVAGTGAGLLIVAGGVLLMMSAIRDGLKTLKDEPKQ